MSQDYHGRLIGHKVTTSGSGAAQVELDFTVSHIQRGQDWEALPQEMAVTVFLSLHENAWKYSTKKLESLGFNGDFRNPVFGTDASTEGVGLRATEETYNNKLRTRWDLANWGGNEPAGDDVLARLNAKYKAGKPVVAKPAGARPVAPPASQTAASPAPVAATGNEPESTGTPDRNSAWNKYLDAAGGKPDLSVWQKLVAQAAKESGRTEAAFVEADWQRVGDLIDVPF